MISVIDYEMGNTGSVINMLKKAGISCKLTRNPAELKSAKGIILPGVGSFDRGMEQLAKYTLINVLNDLVIDRGVPCLGICLGMQLMAQGSEEGLNQGLGWINSVVRKFPIDDMQPRLRVPHMGWNYVEPIMPYNPLFDGLASPLRFYFVHSYCYPANLNCAIGRTKHIHHFTSAFAHKNIYGCQFHPEKSHSFGLSLLSNFNRLTNQ
jgi:imidazole glycerol-phosphate synthase subunit HisH